MSKGVIGVEIELEKSSRIVKITPSKELKEYFNKEFGKSPHYYLKRFIGIKNYNIGMDALNKASSEAIPKEVKENCKYCNGLSEDENDKDCEKYRLQMSMTFLLASSEFINIVHKHRHIYDNKKVLAKLTQNFFRCFAFDNRIGKMYFDLDKICRYILNSGFISISEIFAKSESLQNLKDINNSLNNIEDRDLENKTLKNEDEDYLELQKEFFKNKLRFYKEKLTIEKEQENISKKIESKKQKIISVPIYALYYYYLQASGYYPYFENHPQGKVVGISELIKKEKINTTAKYFQIKYNLISNHKTNRIALNQVSNISFVINEMLENYPKAKELALSELKLAQTKNR
jgi:hypothetical protein